MQHRNSKMWQGQHTQVPKRHRLPREERQMKQLLGPEQVADPATAAGLRLLALPGSNQDVGCGGGMSEARLRAAASAKLLTALVRVLVEASSSTTADRGSAPSPAAPRAYRHIASASLTALMPPPAAGLPPISAFMAGYEVQERQTRRVKAEKQN